ncbi:MAG TPA: hypothetical protein VMV10_02850 [Pirellulales bacterium]|nr:hypothetical protein [Pirellulales bacterium]
MNIWSKVLAGCIVLASLFLFFFAMKMLSAEKNWQQAAKSYDKPLEDAAKRTQLALEGDRTATPPVPGIRDLEVAQHDLLVDRGRVWRNCIAQQVNPNTGQCAVAVADPDPHRIQDKSIIYVFEDGDSTTFHYLGEFKVAAIADKLITLEPTMKLSERQRKSIAGTKAPWLLYERMPVDRSDMFAGLDQQQLATLMPGVPAEVINEYFRNGKEAQPDDPEARVMNGKYERALRDYVVFFHDLHAEIASYQDKIAAATTDLKITQDTLADTQKQVDLRQEQIDKELKPELKEVSDERDLVTTQVEELQKKVAALRAENDATIAENKQLLAQWSNLQFAAAKRLNELIDGAKGGRADKYEEN